MLARLLDRNPRTRLAGLHAVRAHAWLAALDWPALADHQCPPPFVPSSGQVPPRVWWLSSRRQVNARDIHEIDRFDEDETRKITVTEARCMCALCRSMMLARRRTTTSSTSTFTTS